MIEILTKLMLTGVTGIALALGLFVVDPLDGSWLSRLASTIFVGGVALLVGATVLRTLAAIWL